MFHDKPPMAMSIGVLDGQFYGDTRRVYGL